MEVRTQYYDLINLINRDNIMTFEYTHYKITEEQPIDKIEAYLKSIGAFPNSRWNEAVKHYSDLTYVILYEYGKYEFHSHDGEAPEAFLPKTNRN